MVTDDDASTAMRNTKDIPKFHLTLLADTTAHRICDINCPWHLDYDREILFHDIGGCTSQFKSKREATLLSVDTPDEQP